MPHALVLYFDPHATTRVAAAAAAAAPLATGPNVEPHLTLAATEGGDEGELITCADALARHTSPRGIALAAVGSFPGPKGVVFLAPVVTRELLELHAAVHQRLSALRGETVELYRPGAWVPHVTVAMGVPEHAVGEAVTRVRACGAFGDAASVAIGVVEYFPVASLHRVPLQG